jgi:hypothetical protein
MEVDISSKFAVQLSETEGAFVASRFSVGPVEGEGKMLDPREEVKEKNKKDSEGPASPHPPGIALPL